MHSFCCLGVMRRKQLNWAQIWKVWVSLETITWWFPAPAGPSSCREKPWIPSHGGQVSLFPAQLSRCFFQSSCWHSALAWIEPRELKVHVPQPGHVLVWIERARCPAKERCKKTRVLMSCNLENECIIHYIYILNLLCRLYQYNIRM